MRKACWWKETTIYQVYPRSFYDSNGNGIGDLAGIILKLDYIKGLGFETIWFSPFFNSPQADFGYDVSDYYTAAPEYGTQDDIFRLIDEVQKREMRVVFDLVLNHTSDQHPWFLESSSSLENPKRDWYIWKDGKGMKPPNNWKAMPGGSGWHYHEKTRQWYYASFLPFQPDLNFRNPEVKKAMIEMIRFWLDKGVDGFRLDIFHSIFKDASFLDNPQSFHFIPYNDEAGFFQEWKYTVNQPETLAFAREIREIVDSYQPDRFLLGEIFASDEIKRKYLGENEEGLNLVFLWDLPDSKTNAADLRNVIMKYEKEYPEPYLPVYVLGNHDRKRVLSRIGENRHLSKLLAVLIFTARGIPVTYYGEEIGMLDGDFSLKTNLDPVGQRYKFVPEFLIQTLNIYLGRDGCRTPMQWSSDNNAGFSSTEDDLWLPLAPGYKKNNVHDQERKPDSILNLYQELLELRKGSTVLKEGKLVLLEAPPDLLAYDREIPGEKIGIFMNFSNRECLMDLASSADRIILSVASAEIRSGKIQLGPFGAAVIRYKS
jgi:oligo-1,6-glucosidase/alpha-glucosidase